MAPQVPDGPAPLGAVRGRAGDPSPPGLPGFPGPSVHSWGTGFMYGMECAYCGRSKTDNSAVVLNWAANHTCQASVGEYPKFLVIRAPGVAYAPGATVGARR